MNSPFAPGIGGGYTAGSVLEVDAQTLWQLGVVAMQQVPGGIDAATAAMLNSLTPLAGGIGINALNPSTLQATPLSEAVIPSVPRMEESRNTTFEVGYTGLLGDRVLVNTGVWHERRSNFTSPLTPSNPLLLLDSLGIYNVIRPALEGGGMDPAQAHATANALAAGMRGLPLAVASSPEMEDSEHAYLLATYRNFGEVSLTGMDIGVTALLTDQLNLAVSASFVDKDHFFTGGNLVGLNAPSRKATAALQYRNQTRGYNGEFRVRYTPEFPVASAPYSATNCIRDAESVDLPGFTQPCVPSSTILDMNMGYRLPWRNAQLQLSITNLLDAEHRSFAGVPSIGRFAMLRLRQEF
jgi:outer membrane receptor protein involved in Fe transport